MKKKNSVKVTSAWIENDTKLRCKGIVEDIEIDFIAAQIGSDKDGKIWTLDALKIALADIQKKIKKD